MKIHFKRILSVGLLLSLALVVSSCGDKSKQQAAQTKTSVVVAKKKSPVLKLYFSGTLQPLKTIPVVSPVNGQITQMKFTYGSLVKQGDVLATISSTQLADNYRKAISDYLTKKDQYERSIQDYQNNLMLYRAGVLAKNSYSQSKATFEANVLSFYQSRYDLEKILTKTGLKTSEVEKLSISDTQQVDKILQRKFSDIKVIAPGTGVALFPTADTMGGGGDKGSGPSQLTVGTDLKANGLMLTLGDMSGLTVKVQVSEININKIKTGMPVTITGDAFPATTLKGQVFSVSSQAQQSQDSSGLSKFDVVVKVPKITPEQAKILHVGMSARVEVAIKQSPRILLPISAITFNQAGQPTVTLQTNTGQKKVVVVQTGRTTATDIAIRSGVKVGDKVIVPEKASQ